MGRMFDIPTNPVICTALNIQNRFLSYATFLLKIDHPQHDNSLIRSALKLSFLASR